MRHSLSIRARRLLLGTALLAALLSALAAWTAWTVLLQSHARREAEEIRRHYQDKVAETRAGWHEAAERLRVQMEFMRLGDLPPARWRVTLHAFFTALGEYREFPALVFADANGQPFFSQGCPLLLQGGLDLLGFLDSGFKPGEDSVLLHSTCEQNGVLYGVVSTRLWLGPQGKGTLLLATALDNAWLRRLASKPDQLYLYSGGRVLASSEGTVAMPPDWAPDKEPMWLRQDVLHIGLPLDNPAGGAPVWLVIRHPLKPLWSGRDAVLAAALATGLLLLLLWFGVGRAMRGHVARLAALDSGARAFEQHFQRGGLWQDVLFRVRRTDDELAHLAGTLDRLMEEAESRQREARAYQETLGMLEEVVLELDGQGIVRHASAAWAVVGGEEGSPVGRPLLEYLSPEAATILAGQLAVLVRGEQQRAVLRLSLPPGKGGEGAERWVELHLARAEGGTLRGVLRDITHSHLQEQRIQRLALYDPLTGLPNRALLEDRLQVAQHRARRDGQRLALGFLDLDHFKHINDSLGHKAGDEVLAALAARLRQSLRGSDTLARWGGDEFVVLLTDLPAPEAAHEVAEKLLAVLAAPVQVAGRSFYLTCSAGFALFPDDAADSETLLSRADEAMYRAKALGRNQVQWYGRPQDDGGSGRENEGPQAEEKFMRQHLAAVIREERIQVHYQPMVEAASGRVAAVEALARWFDPGRGWLEAGRFIALAEQYGLIGVLGEQVWQRALTDFVAFGRRDLSLAVNLSPRQLCLPGLVPRLVDGAAAHGIEPRRIVLEITESLPAGNEACATERLKALRAAGFRIAVDDFGTGYASLSRLYELPVTELKIDRSHVVQVRDPKGARLVEGVVGIARAFGLSTVAEGVEDEVTARRLQRMGVQVLQGYYFARPMPAGDCARWLATRQEAASAHA